MPANRLNSQEIQGRFVSSTQGMCVGSTFVMPVADQYRFGIVIQYLGETENGFIKNHLYLCASRDNGYQWEDVTPVREPTYTPESVLGTDSQGFITDTAVSVGELEMLIGATSNIQQQIDSIELNTTTQLSNKVDKVEGMGLSEQNYTTEDKNKLSSVQYNAQVNSIEEIQINNVTVQPQNRIINLSVLEGHTYPMGNLTAGQGFEVKHNLIRTVFFAQVRDGNGMVVNGSMQVNDTVATIVPDANATNCTMFIICGGI